MNALLSLIPPPTPSFANPLIPGMATFYEVTSQPTNWRQELLRLDHNITDKERVSFHYIHDSWDTVNQVPLWTNTGNFPTVQTAFTGPGISMLARLSSTFTPTLLNEFVFSYTTDHIGLTDLGNWQRPSGTTFGSIFPGADRGVMPGINLLDPAGIYGNFGEDAGYIPNGPYNSNPTYSFRDNLNKLVGKHNLQMGAYFQAVEKNELGGELAEGSYPGYITFNPGCPATAPTTGNPFADLLLGNICSFGQQNTTIKYYNRYKMVEPYFQDDWHLTNRLTLNLGLRVSLFGTYREKEHQAFNFDPAHYVAGQTTVDPNTDIATNLTANNGLPTVTELAQRHRPMRCDAGRPRGLHDGSPVQSRSPRRLCLGSIRKRKDRDSRWVRNVLRAWERQRGQYRVPGELSAPRVCGTAIQHYRISQYWNRHSWRSTPVGCHCHPHQGPVALHAAVALRHSARNRSQHSRLDLLCGKQRYASYAPDRSQPGSPPASQNPYKQGETYTGAECSGTLDNYDVPTNATTPSGVPIPYIPGVNGGPPSGPAVNVAIAAGCVPAGADPFRPYPGYGDIAHLQTASSSNYNALQVLVRRSVGGLELDFAYTYSHSIDDSSDRYDGSFTNTYNSRSQPCQLEFR